MSRAGPTSRLRPSATDHGSDVRRSSRSPPRTAGSAGNVVLKLEFLQHTGSFKARGALNSVLSVPDGTSGVCAASGGNHAAAVAWAARSRRHDGRCLRADQRHAGQDRADRAVRRADPSGRRFREGCARCVSARSPRPKGVPLLHPFDTFETVAGAGTMALEIEEQVPDVERIVVGCGGGGLYAGLAIALDGSVRVQPVEPDAVSRSGRCAGGRAPRRHRRSGVSPPTRSVRRTSVTSPTRRRSTTRSSAVLVEEAGHPARASVPLGSHPRTRRAGCLRGDGRCADRSGRRSAERDAGRRSSPAPTTTRCLIDGSDAKSTPRQLQA